MVSSRPWADRRLKALLRSMRIKGLDLGPKEPRRSTAAARPENAKEPAANLWEPRKATPTAAYASILVGALAVAFLTGGSRIPIHPSYRFLLAMWLGLAGWVLGLIAGEQIRRRPGVYGGKMLARIGILVSLVPCTWWILAIGVIFFL